MELEVLNMVTAHHRAGDRTIPPPLVTLTGTVNVGGIGLQCSGQGDQRGLYSRDFHNDVSTGFSYKTGTAGARYGSGPNE